MTRKKASGKPKGVKHRHLGKGVTTPARTPAQMWDDETLYRDLFEQSPNGIILIDAENGRTIKANAAAYTQLGYTRDEFATLKISDYEARETSEETQAHMAQVLSTGADEFETQHRTKDGQIRDIRVLARSVILGERQAFYCIFEDITARRKAERELRQTEQILSEAETTAGLGTFVMDVSTNRWQSSAELDRIFGIDERYDRVVEGWLALVHPEWRARMQAYLTKEVLGALGRFDKEYKIVRASDAQERWVHGLGHLEFDDHEHVRAMRDTIQDITERKQAEESQQLQSAALNAAANAIVITDRAGAIVWVNRAFTALTGYAAHEVLGQNPRLLKSSKHDLAFYQSLWTTVLSGRTWRGETTNRRKDGSLYTEHQTITPVVNESGVITQFISIKEDITDRLRLQAQLLQAQKMEAVGRLAGGVAHDFNNLLTVIGSYCDLMFLDMNETDTRRQELLEIRGATDRAAVLARQLLAFSRQQVVQPRVCDVNDAVRAVESMLGRTLPSEVKLNLRLATPLGAVRTDPGQIEQVLMNLIMNAAHAMPDGGSLVIETGNAMLDAMEAGHLAGASPGAYVVLSVSDTGTGMDQRTVEHIFEPFFTTKPQGKGTGLGLSTVYAIATQNGGHVTVSSELGVGSTFKVSFPLVHEEVSAPEPTRLQTAVGTHETQTVLVVEDEPSV